MSEHDYNEALENRNIIIDDLLVLLKGNHSRKKIYQKELELQQAELKLKRVTKKRISLLRAFVNKLKSMSMC